MEQQFAGGAGNEASCFLLGCTVGSHDTDGERRRVGRTRKSLIAPGGAVSSHIGRFSPHQTWASHPV